MQKTFRNKNKKMETNHTLSITTEELRNSKKQQLGTAWCRRLSYWDVPSYTWSGYPITAWGTALWQWPSSPRCLLRSRNKRNKHHKHQTKLSKQHSRHHVYLLDHKKTNPSLKMCEYPELLGLALNNCHLGFGLPDNHWKEKDMKMIHSKSLINVSKFVNFWIW